MVALGSPVKNRASSSSLDFPVPGDAEGLAKLLK